MKIRVFYKVHTLHGTKSPRWTNDKKQTDFETETAEEAFEEVYKEYGRKVVNANSQKGDTLACSKYAEIVGHALITGEGEHGEIEGFRAYDQCLFSPQVMRDCISYKDETRPF